MKFTEKIRQKAHRTLIPLAFVTLLPLLSSCNEYVKKIKYSAYRHGSVVLKDSLFKTVQSQDAISPKEAYVYVMGGLQRQVDTGEYDSVQVAVTVTVQPPGNESELRETLLPKK